MRPANQRPIGPAHDPAPPRGPRVLRRAGLLLTVLALAACGSEPPEALGGFRLGLSQSELMAQAYDRDGFVCRLVASRPKVTFCSGPSELGMVEAMARGDSTVRITLEVGRNAEDPAGTVRELVDPFGEPAWRDRPYPPTSDPPEGYHTLWVTDDSTRAIALLCRGEALGPPCNARLMRTSPAAIEAKLDSLLNIP